jgi:type I restriction enzyme S subunit
MSALIGNLTNIKTGKLDANAASSDGKYPFFTCAQEPLAIDRYAYDCDAILVAGNGDLNVKHYKGKFEAYQRTYIIQVADESKLDSRYLYYFMSKYVDKLRELSIGGVIKYIKLGMLTDAEIPLPPLEEQKRIAAILDKADAIRRKRQAAIKLADDFLRATFLDMFGDPVTNPKGWAVKPLSKLCDVRDGTHDSPKYVQYGYPLITSKNVKNGSLDFLDVSLISEADFIQINKRSGVDIGDIIMPMIGTIGNPVLVETTKKFAIKNVALIKFQKADVNNDYILHLLKSHYFQNIIQRSNRGGTQKFIALSDIRSFPIPVPDGNNQAKFSMFCEKFKKFSFREYNINMVSDSLFNALTQCAFRGDL